MALLPTATGIPDTDIFPMYALPVILLGMIGMTVSLTVYRRWPPRTVAPAHATP